MRAFLPLKPMGEVVGGLEEQYHDMVLADGSFTIGPISAASQDRSKLHNVQQYTALGPFQLDMLHFVQQFELETRFPK